VRRALRVAALTLALTTAAPLAATAALAENGTGVPIPGHSGTGVDDPTTWLPGVSVPDDPGSLVPDTGSLVPSDDNTIEALDLAADAASGCTTDIDAHPPFDWSESSSPADPSSTHIHEWSQATFSASGSCRAGVLVQVCLTDSSVRPLWDTYGPVCDSNESADRDVTAMVEQDVPYYGAEANGVRPYGEIYVTIKGWNKRSDGGYPRTPTRCMSYRMAFEPKVGVYTLEQRVDCPSVLATEALLSALAAT
jgi:hypothetical protein